MDLFNFQNFLSDKDIENLKNYKYKPGEYTVLDKKLNPFWLWAVEYLPRNLAPNMITLIALACGIIPILLFIIYDPSLVGPYPLVLYLLAILGIFLYQTLDALDGKQARRIGKFSPLGQLFDHGCDSFSTAAFALYFLVCLRMDNFKLNILCYLCYMLMTYLSNLTEHFTEVMHTNLGSYFGVTEMQFFSMICLFFEAFGAFDYLRVPLPFIGIQINELMGWGALLTGIYSVFFFGKHIWEEVKDHKRILLGMCPYFYICIMSKQF